MSLLIGLVPIAGIGLVVGGAALVSRLTERSRDLTSPPVVVDRRTLRAAARRVDRMVEIEDWTRAHTAATAICVWLNGEKIHGSPARQQRTAAELERWTARKQELFPGA